MGPMFVFDRHDHLNRMAGINLETVKPSRRFAAEHRAGGRLREGFAEQSEGLWVAGWWNMGNVKEIHYLTMRLGVHRDNPAC